MNEIQQNNLVNKVLLAIILLFTISGTFAQKGKVNNALELRNTGKLDKALTTIEETIDANNPKAESSINWPRTWEVRGEIYQAIFQSKDENIKKLSADPLTVAYDSYFKVLELDAKKSFSKSIKIKFTLLIGDLANQAFTAFNDEDYEKALKSFEQILNIEQNPVYKADDPIVVDTVIIYNAALSAFNTKNYDKAIEYYKKAAFYKYNGAKTYEMLSICYLNKKDTVGAIEILKEGLKENPTSSTILVQLIDIYEKSHKVEDALKYLDLAISKEPGNESFYLFRGILFERLQNTDEAIKCYEKAIELKQDYMEAFFNLGIIFYNRGVKQIDVANLVPSNQPEKYDAEKDKADLEFRKALPYLEKALAINGTDKMTLESLKNVYYRLQMLDKHAEIIENMKNLQE